MKFLTDSRHAHKGETMFDNFDQYQGPALYAWNDALFEKDDWHALAKINQSSKRDDTLKVGRFGLGFLSVFHLTGKQLTFLQGTLSRSCTYTYVCNQLLK